MIHGPTVIDTGWTERILHSLERLGEVRAKLGGTTGYVALLDARLDSVVEFDRKLPSECLSDLNEWADVLVLTNHGKSRESGLAFAEQVLSRAEGVDSLVQVERPGEPDGGIVLWNPDDVERKVAEHLQKDLGLEITEVRTVRTDKGGETGRSRRIACVEPGDLILVNGITVGVAESRNVELVFDDSGYLVEIRGGRIKPEGVERLGQVDPERVVVKTDRRLRRTEPKRRRVKNGPARIRRILLIDHDAERKVEDMRRSDAVVSVGDDTTCVCAELGDRLGVWVIGIVDLDPDGWVRDDTRESLRGSENLMALLVCERDDDAGELVRERFFRGREVKVLDPPVTAGDLVEEVKECVKEVLKCVYHKAKETSA
ncbi:DUF2117 domain-containing protein [Methanopyrus sp. SNP6]|uniref:DUF2117 domain-containing protein n=1 Tax=Methanopyrus sp. SNP6 TaxID=1937005 RepID=UPI0014393E7A|nr:DUF2117 domain-containing protein [Methanopyrus sp. SNP6]